jgi:hypothetical protein
VISPYELGWHGNCYSALAKAKLLFMQSNGCAECCPECHTVSASKGHDFKPSDF